MERFDFEMRRTNVKNIDVSDFRLPYTIKLALWDTFEGFPQKYEGKVYYDVVEYLGITSVYIDLDQFKGMTKNMSRYATFKTVGAITIFYGSNVIDRDKTVDHENYFAIEL